LGEDYKYNFLKPLITSSRIFEPMRDEMEEGWRKLHNEELHHLYSSPSIIRVIKSRRMRWAWHPASLRNRNAYRILVGRPEGKS
jgi:hypothetical protein